MISTIRFKLWRLLLALVCCVSTCLGVVSANELARLDQEPGILTGQSTAGKFLVASEHLRDPNFLRAVVLMFEHSKEGAIGVVVNRKSDIDVSVVIPEVQSLRDGGHKLFDGGPVSHERILLLYRHHCAQADSLQILDEVFVTTSRATLELLAAGSCVSTFRVVSGYAGWGPGQLESELARDDWRVSDADAGTLFEIPPEELWNTLHRRTAGTWALVSRCPAP